MEEREGFDVRDPLNALPQSSTRTSEEVQGFKTWPASTRHPATFLFTASAFPKRCFNGSSATSSSF